MQKSRFLNRIHTVTLQTKLIFSFIATTIIILIVNLFMYQNINQLVNQLDAIYLSNVQLNELGEALNDVQDSMTLYLNTKTSDAMESYYRAEQDYSMLIQNLNEKVTDDNLQMMERMIRNMSDNYLEITNQTVEAKRGRNIEKYKRSTVIFPEGTRSKTGEPRPFAVNGLKILCKNAPSSYVLPVTINNSWKMTKWGSFPLGIGNKIEFIILNSKK